MRNPNTTITPRVMTGLTVKHGICLHRCIETSQTVYMLDPTQLIFHRIRQGQRADIFLRSASISVQTNMRVMNLTSLHTCHIKEKYTRERPAFCIECTYCPMNPDSIILLISFQMQRYFKCLPTASNLKLKGLELELGNEIVVLTNTRAWSGSPSLRIHHFY